MITNDFCREIALAFLENARTFVVLEGPVNPRCAQHLKEQPLPMEMSIEKHAIVHVPIMQVKTSKSVYVAFLVEPDIVFAISVSENPQTRRHIIRDLSDVLATVVERYCSQMIAIIVCVAAAAIHICTVQNVVVVVTVLARLVFMSLRDFRH